MSYHEDLENWEKDDPRNEDIEEQEPIRFEDRFEKCPNCRKMITADMDSCPYCGDILYRYFKDGIFMPKKGLAAKVVAGVVIVVIALGILGFIMMALGLP